MPASISTPQTLATTYKDAASLGFQEGDSVVFQSTGGPLVFQFANDDPSGAVSYQDQEVTYPPGTWAFKNTKGIRFRSNVGSAAATLQSATLFFNDDPEPFTPGNVPGTVSLTSTLNIQHNDVLVGVEPTLDFEDGTNLTWTVVDDAANTRVKVTPSLTGVVTTFNSRSGTVVPTTGDYTAAQVTNALDLSNAGTQTLTGSLLVDKQFASATSNSSVASGAIAITTNAVRITATDGSNVANITGAIGAEPLYLFNTSGSSITFVTGGGVTGLRVGFTLGNGNVAFLYYDSSGGLWTPFSIVGGGGVPAVNSVFGRTGNVVATSGDYTAAQVTNALDLSATGTQTMSGALATPDTVYMGQGTTFVTGGGVTWTINYATGNFQAANIDVAGATTLTIGTPTNEPPAGQTGILIMLIENTAASGGTTLTWSGAFLNAFSSITKPTSVNFGTSILLFFVFNSVTSGWKCVGQF